MTKPIIDMYDQILNTLDRYLNRVDDLISNSLALFEAGKFDEIIELSNRLLEFENQNATAFFYRGIALWGKGDLINGIDDIEKVLDQYNTAITNGKNRSTLNILNMAIREHWGDFYQAVKLVHFITEPNLLELKKNSRSYRSEFLDELINELVGPK